MRSHVVFACAAILAAGTAAHADVVLPGSYGGGTPLATTGKTLSGTSISYTDSVYADAGNPFCDGCMDFVIQVDDAGISQGVLSVSTTGFAGYSLEFAYEDNGDIAPTSVTTNKSGNKVTFDISLLADDSDPLIIYTDAANYKDGGLTINHQTTDPPAFAPYGPLTPDPAPEPSSLVLAGTGLLGVAGMLRWRRARAASV